MAKGHITHTTCLFLAFLSVLLISSTLKAEETIASEVTENKNETASETTTISPNNDQENENGEETKPSDNEEGETKDPSEKEDDSFLRKIKLPKRATQSLMDLARKFQELVFVSDVDKYADPIRKILKDNSDYTEIVQELMSNIGGVIACLVITILFLVFMMVTSCTLWTCRLCCSKCGGSRKLSYKENTSCKKNMFALFFIAAMAINLTGLIVMFESSGNVKDLFPQTVDDVEKVVNGLISYVNKTSAEVKGVAGDDVDELLDNFIKTMSSVDQRFQNIQSSSNYEYLIKNGSEILEGFQRSLNNLPPPINQDENLKELKKDIEKALEQVTKVKDGIKSAGEEIQNKALEESRGINDKVKAERNLSSISENFDNIIKELRKSHGELSKVRKEYGEIQKKIPLDILSLIPCLLILIPTCLLLIGFLFGCLGYQRKRNPTNRTCISNFGGLLMVITSYFIPIITNILMLVLFTLFFLMGISSLFCAFSDKPEELDKVLDILRNDTDVFKGVPSFLKDMQIKTFLERCEKETIVSVFGLDKQINLEKIKGDFNLDKVQEKIEQQVNTSVGNKFNELGDVSNTAVKIQEDWKKISGAASSPPAEVEKSYKRLEDWMGKEGKIIKEKQREMKEETIQIINNIFNEILKKVNESVTAIFDKVQTEIAQCKPLYVTYQNVHTIVCNKMFDPLNGLWFGLGTCVFFLAIGMVFALLLSKHFLKMKRYKDKFMDGGDGRHYKGYENGYDRRQNGAPFAYAHPEECRKEHIEMTSRPQHRY